MKNNMKVNNRRELSLDEVEQVNGSSWLVTIVVIGAWAATMTAISYFAGESDKD